ncbi:MAG: glycosyltransferase [Roseburia sp.]|nr:glycosyltransferase [Roseburia sp.]MCM1241725.1 glycosyltransferase [Roseburia sp.]
MKLSIIVPVYNMAADGKLQYCLESLVHQTIEDFEIIAVDDASTDDSLKILKQYEQKYPEKFRAIHSQVNKKQGGAKNIGMGLAKGEWIGFIDSDDWVAADFYERLIRRGEETGADMVGCDYHLTDKHSMEIGQIVHNNKKEQTGILDEEKYKSLILDSGSLVVKVYRREIVIDHPGRFPEGIFYEDNALGNSWMLRAKHFEYIEEPLYYYYQHAVSTVHTITQKRCEDRMEAGRIMIKEAETYHYLETYHAELEFSFTVLFYVNTLFTYMQGVRPVRYGFVKKLGKEMKRTFPRFQENPYYLERVQEEEKKLVGMQMRSTLWFILYYKLLWAYRNFRKRRQEAGADT